MEWYNNMHWFTKLDILFLIGTLSGVFIYVIVALFKKHKERRRNEEFSKCFRDSLLKQTYTNWEERLEEVKKQKEENPEAFSFTNPSAMMYFGPKDKAMQCCHLFYVPTPEQIRNIKEMFGWDVEVLKK